MPITTSSFFSINAEFAASTASNAQISLQDTAIAAQIYPTGGGRLFGPIDFSTIQSVSTSTVYGGAANYGWFAGGQPGPTNSTERIDFSNDLVRASTRGTLNTGVRAGSAVNNANYGWIGGGWAAPVQSIVQRIDFANDSPTSAILRGPLSGARGYMAGTGNGNYGWFAGGQDMPATPGTMVTYSKIDRIDYSNDNVTTSVRGVLSVARWGMGGAGNSNYGWFASGGVGASNNSSTVERLNYANDSPTAPSTRTSLPMPRVTLAGVSNSNYGWFGGGYTVNTNILSLIHRIDFANDSPTSASTRGPLVAVRAIAGATGNTNYGWFGGGFNVNPTAISTVDRIDYSSDTVTASTRGQLNTARYSPSATSNYVKAENGVLAVAKQPLTEVWSIFTATTQAKWAGVVGTYGWFAGSQAGGGATTVNRIDFANDSPTAASPRGLLSAARGSMNGATDGSFGWFAGGYIASGGVQKSQIDRINFANDSPTAASPRGNLSRGRGHFASLQNSDFYWVAGNKGDNSGVDRIDFGNDTATPSLRGNLLVTSQGRAGLSNQFYGWAVGGEYISSIERIDFANDSPTSGSPRGPLTNVRARAGSVGNSNYGWIIGGNQPAGVSIVERLDYSNDSPTAASPRSTGATSLNGWGNASNEFFGWIAGGSGSSSVFRIDYANDTTVPSPRGLLTVSQDFPGGTSNYVRSRSQPAGTTTSTAYFPASIIPVPAGDGANVGTFGWTAGGNGSGSTIDKIDFANDSPTAASPRGNLPTNGTGLGGASNANYGWTNGGSGGNAAVYRIDFSNDLVLASTRGSLVTGSQDLGVTGNTNFGWFGGGSGVTSRIERVNYANDSPASASPRGPLSQARQSLAAVATNSYGWWVGGYAPGNTSRVDRVDFANDSPTAAVARSPGLPITNRDLAATGNTDYGWFGGGTPAISTVYRIQYSTDTVAAITRGPLSKTRSNIKGMGNVGFGWIGGDSPNNSSVDRINYANDSPTAASPRGNFSTPRSSFAAFSNYAQGTAAIVGNAIIYTTATTTPIVVDGNYGWWTGGQTPTIVSTVDRIDFSNDSPTAASSRGSLRLARANSGAVSNVNYGWIGGGSTPGSNSSVDRIDFANDSGLSVIRSNLSSARAYISATGNNNYGWFGGGYVSTNRLDYSNDTLTASARGNLSTTRQQVSATGNANYGWFGGGYASTTVYSIVDRIDFANDSPTTASPRGRLTSARYVAAATGNANYGWWGGGRSDTFNVVSNVDRVDFANDSPTSASPRSPLNLARSLSNGATGNANYGWFGGGFAPAPGVRSIVDRIDFSNDTAAVSIRGLLSLSRDYGASVSNTAKDNLTFSAITGNVGTYGWWGGGYGPLSTVDRIDFSNDSPTAASPRGLLSAARLEPAAAGNANYGWFGGGQVPGITGTSLVDRIDFSNDSPASASVRGPLSIARYGLAATGNANYGWFGGGYGVTRYSTVDRIDFSNDSPASASVRGPLAVPRSSVLAAVSNANYAWFGGGNGPSAVTVSTVDRIDFANDSPTAASARGLLSAARYRHAATGNANYGWFGGGTNPVGNADSTIDRIDFANDSPTAASARGPLSSIRMRFAATSNANYGWFGGGGSDPGDSRSTVDRIDFANDSPTAASPRGPLSAARRGLSAVSNYVQSRTEIIVSRPVNWDGGTWIRGGLSIA